MKDQVVLDDLDPVSIAEPHGLEGRQPLATQVSAVLAVQIHQLIRAIRQTLDAGVWTRDPDVVDEEVEVGQTTDVEVLPPDLADR